MLENTIETTGLGQSLKPLLSLAKCRAILGADAPESDANLALLRDQLYGLARVVVEAFSGERRGKFSSCAAKGQTGLDDFSETLASLSEDERFAVEERAAIHEFDGGLDRSAAERAAISEYWRNKHRKDSNE